MSDATTREDMGALPLAACLLAIAILGFVVFGPFLVTFVVAASTALLLAPAYERLARAAGGRSSVAAGGVVVLCAALLALLLVTYAALLRAQARSLLESTAPLLQPGAAERWWSRTLAARYPSVPTAIADVLSPGRPRAGNAPFARASTAARLGPSSSLLTNLRPDS